MARLAAPMGKLTRTARKHPLRVSRIIREAIQRRKRVRVAPAWARRCGVAELEATDRFIAQADPHCRCRPCFVRLPRRWCGTKVCGPQEVREVAAQARRQDAQGGALRALLGQHGARRARARHDVPQAHRRGLGASRVPLPASARARLTRLRARRSSSPCPSRCSFTL